MNKELEEILRRRRIETIIKEHPYVSKAVQERINALPVFFAPVKNRKRDVIVYLIGYYAQQLSNICWKGRTDNVLEAGKHYDLNTGNIKNVPPFRCLLGIHKWRRYPTHERCDRCERTRRHKLVGRNKSMTEKPVATTEDLLKLGFSKKTLGLNNKYHPPVRRTVKIGFKDIGGGYLEASDGSIYYRRPSGEILSQKVRMTKAEKKARKRVRRQGCS